MFYYQFASNWVETCIWPSRIAPCENKRYQVTTSRRYNVKTSILAVFQPMLGGIEPGNRPVFFPQLWIKGSFFVRDWKNICTNIYKTYLFVTLYVIITFWCSFLLIAVIWIWQDTEIYGRQLKIWKMHQMEHIWHSLTCIFSSSSH